MWLQLYNYKIYIKLIIAGLGYNGLKLQINLFLYKLKDG